MVVGLGSGKASTAFIERLGQRVQQGLNVRGVPTSQASADLATRLGIPLLTLDQIESIDVTCDGADEVDPQGNCIKGYGGALVREKVVAAASQKLAILVGAEKLVQQLGERGKLPVEVVPFAAAFCQRRFIALGLKPQVRQQQGGNYLTDNGNLILDCGTGPIADPGQLESNLLATPGVVGAGLFLSMANLVLIERNGGVEVRSFK
jgi:ribose 5-phosphate isomerase A